MTNPAIFPAGRMSRLVPGTLYRVEYTCPRCSKLGVDYMGGLRAEVERVAETIVCEDCREGGAK